MSIRSRSGPIALDETKRPGVLVGHDSSIRFRSDRGLGARQLQRGRDLDLITHAHTLTHANTAPDRL